MTPTEPLALAERSTLLRLVIAKLVEVALASVVLPETASVPAEVFSVPIPDAVEERCRRPRASLREWSLRCRAWLKCIVGRRLRRCYWWLKSLLEFAKYKLILG